MAQLDCDTAAIHISPRGRSSLDRALEQVSLQVLDFAALRIPAHSFSFIHSLEDKANRLRLMEIARRVGREFTGKFPTALSQVHS